MSNCVDCCTFIDFECIYKETPLHHADTIEYKEHILSDIKNDVLENIFGDDCLEKMCKGLNGNEILLSDQMIGLTDDSDNTLGDSTWQTIISNKYFVRMISQYFWYYFLVEYAGEKYEDNTEDEVKRKYERALEKAEKSELKFKECTVFSPSP